MRLLLRERLAAGDNDQQVRDFLVRRYGQFVLLRPPIEPATYVLWFGPFAVLAIGAAGIAVYLRRRSAGESVPAPLDESERRRLARLLKEDG